MAMIAGSLAKYKKRERHRPCWLRKRWKANKVHQTQCKRYDDCCVCAGWTYGHTS